MTAKSGRPRRPSHRGLGLLHELGADAFSRAWHSHIEDLAYELLKDPAYQESMRQLLMKLTRSLSDHLAHNGKAHRARRA